VAAGFVLVSRLGWHGVDGPDAGMMSYLLFVPPLTFVAGSATAAATGPLLPHRAHRLRLSHRAGRLLVVVAWLAEAPHWYRRLGAAAGSARARRRRAREHAGLASAR
jgi:hypothetical protein